MLHKQVTSVDHLNIHLQYKLYGFGALAAHLTVHSAIPVVVSQANQLLDMEHHGDAYERDIALVRDEPLYIASESARMLLIYSGNKFIQVSEREGATLVTDGIGVIEEGGCDD